ncbi:putative long tail fiber protein [uncultured Mediterranean phage]|nr:putative long tail fiber protein [uncultured Mediterranean phage]
MPSQQLELKSDITNLFKDLESIAKETKVHAPHVPKIEKSDITELFSGLNEAHEEAKIEVELRLSLEEKNELDIITSLADTFSEITKPEASWPPEQPPEHYPKPVDESAKLEALEELFSTITEPNSEDIVVDEIKVDTISEEPNSVEKTATLIDKAIVHLDSLEEKTEITEEVNQIATLRKEFDNFRALISQQIASSQMSGAGGGEVRLEFLDDIDRDSVKVDGKFLKYQASTGKFIGADTVSITDEQLEDVVGAMVSSNTESGISVAYDDTNGKLNFTVGTLNQDTTGNAATATVLETARTIGGVSFNGSANIDLPGVNSAGNQNTTGSAATLTNARTIGGVSFDGSANINLPGVNTSGSQDTSGNAATATALATARNIHGVSFDGTGNIDLSEVIQDTVGAMFSSNTETNITATYEDSDGTIDLVIGTLNQDTTGNAATATALETARTIHGVSFDGSANIDLSEVIQDTVGAMFGSNTETDITVTYQDADGTIDLVVSDISGNAATATALANARTIAGVSFDGTANITIASTDLSNTSAITLLTATQTLTNKTLTSPVINTGLSGSAFLDEDDMSSNSATKVASQQSIKAFVDAVESRTRAFAIAIGAGL